jgi:hypothetical protein
VTNQHASPPHGVLYVFGSSSELYCDTMIAYNFSTFVTQILFTMYVEFRTRERPLMSSGPKVLDDIIPSTSVTAAKASSSEFTCRGAGFSLNHPVSNGAWYSLISLPFLVMALFHSHLHSLAL